MRALVLTVARREAELAADDLWALGVMAVEERASADAGSIELWTSLGDDGPSLTETLRHLRWPWRLETVDEAVSETWRNFALPTWVDDDLVVHPAWVDPGDVDAAIAIAIEPGSTFGMGDHPTTTLSMRALRRAVVPGDRVLDVGCGSGVLAIAACRFGAAHAIGIDISPAAVPTTEHNAAINGVSDHVRVSITPLAEIDAMFEVVVANILAPALVALANDLRRVLAADGTLIISGILAERHQHVLDALAPLRVVGREDRDIWTAISLRC